MAEFEPVLRTPELGPGEMRQVEAHGESLVVVNLGQTYFAVDGRCPHDGTALGEEGRLNGQFLICPRDDSVYDVTTGERVEPPGGPALRRFTIRVEENTIKVGPPQAGRG